MDEWVSAVSDENFKTKYFRTEFDKNQTKFGNIIVNEAYFESILDKNMSIFNSVSRSLPMQLYSSQQQLNRLKTQLKSINNISYSTLSSKTIANDEIMEFSIKLIASSTKSKTVALASSQFCNLMANLLPKGNAAKKIVNGFQLMSSAFDELENELMEYQDMHYLMVILNQERHRSMFVIDLQQVQFFYLDPRWKNRERESSKFFSEFWNDCVVKLCSKIRDSKRLNRQFRNRFDPDVAKLENIIENSNEPNQVGSHLSSIYLIHYACQFFLLHNFDHTLLVTSTTNNDDFIMNVFTKFWRIALKPFVSNQVRKRKRQEDTVRQGLKNTGSRTI